MIRVLLFGALFAACPAWAVGERLSIRGPGTEQLSQTLCISMECVKSGDYSVTSKVIDGKMELKLVAPSGPRLSLALPIEENGKVSNSEVMAASTQLVIAIENPQAPKEAAPVKAAKKKHSKLAKASKRKLVKAVGLAPRKLSRG